MSKLSKTRKFKYLEKTDNKFRIISYNILADYLNDPEYVLVKKKYLDNAFRIKLLINIFIFIN